VIGKYETLVKPEGRFVSSEALEVNGLDLEECEAKGISRKKLFSTIKGLAEKYTVKEGKKIKKPIIVAHNAPYDIEVTEWLFWDFVKSVVEITPKNSKKLFKKGVEILNTEFEIDSGENGDVVFLHTVRERENVWDYFDRFFICTMRLAQMLHKDLPSYSLSKLCEKFSIYNTNAHSAGADVEATIELFKMLLLSGSSGSAKEGMKEGVFYL
jgi:DNA polymerase III epsilon subunit-like protein